MCNALRVSKEEMRNFVQGKSIQPNSNNNNAAESSHSDNRVSSNGPLHLQGNQQVRNDDGGLTNRNNRHGATNPLQHKNRQQSAVVNPYAKQSRPSSSHGNNVARENNSNSGMRPTHHGINNQQDGIRSASSQANALVNQQRPPTANPYSNNRITSGNVTSQNNSAQRPVYNDSWHQENNQQQHQNQQQRTLVNNPYNKSGNNPYTMSRSNVPTTTSNRSSATSSNGQTHSNDSRQSSNQTNLNNIGNNQRSNPQLHGFFTGARPTTSAQPSQRPQTQARTNMPAARNNNAARASSSSNRQRLSLSAKKQLPYVQGPVPLCAATSHNWIYPKDDKYPERIYQLEMSESAIMNNTLVSLPTGLGKTLIAAVVMYNYYRWFPEGKVIFCAPTRPLVTQQIQACYKIMGIPERQTAEISGRVPNTSRQKIWDNKRVFFCTPQTLVKDIEEHRCDASKIVCVVMDEAHRATGNHTFALLPNMIEEAGAKFRLVALSATPGTDIKSIQAVVETLKISKIEARTEDDPNVKRYIHNREEEVISVKQPDVIKILDKKLLEFVREPLERLRSVNAASRLMGDSANLSPYAVMKAREEYVQRTGDHRLYHIFEALRSLVDVRINLKNHGIQYALQNIARKEVEARGPLRSIFHSDSFKALKVEMQAAAGDPTVCLSKNNPKYEKLTDVLLEHFERKQAIGESTRAIVFSQLRESVMGIVSMLSSKNTRLLKPTPFVGQSRKKESESNPGQEVAGMNQAEQQRILKHFNEGIFNILVCTCVGEEGLDIGDVDLIVNFDILKSAIRSIQRTGRTGRKRNGRVIFLVSEGQEERSYRDSVTNSKKIARALKDPSVFKLCQNSPMFPDEPALLRQKMVVDDFHMSQVGGHTPKTRGGKSGRSGKSNGEKLAGLDNKWILSQAEQKERMKLFGNLPYSSHSEYGCETTPGAFPALLRKKYLKARRSSHMSRNTGKGRSSAILASLEQLHLHPPERRKPDSTPIRGQISQDEDVMMSNNSDDEVNASVNFDVESDYGFGEELDNGHSSIISERNDGEYQNGYNEVSPEHSKDSLGAIFGEIAVDNSNCLNSEQMAILFDADDHKHCSIKAPPQFGNFHCDDTSASSEESSSQSSISSKQSQSSNNTMDDDALCAFFDKTELPSEPKQKSPLRKQQNSMSDEHDDNDSVENNVVDDEKNADYELGDDNIDGLDFHMADNDIGEDDNVHSYDNVENTSIVGNPEMNTRDPTVSTSQQAYNSSGVENGHVNPPGSQHFSSTMGANTGENSAEVDEQRCNNENVDDCQPDALDSIGGCLSPIAPLSQVVAFRLPTPPPSSSEDDSNDSDNQSCENEDGKGNGNNSSDVIGARDVAKSSQDSKRSQPVEINVGDIFSSNDGNEMQGDDNFKDKIDPLQLPTQYSSSSDDDDASESQSVCENNAEEENADNNKGIQSVQKYSIGTKVSKEFKDPSRGKLRSYQGEIVAFYSQDNQDKLYNEVFEDGDREDLEEGEIDGFLAVNTPSNEDNPQSQSLDPRKGKASNTPSQMSPNDLEDTPVKKNAQAISRMSLNNSMDTLTDTPVVQRRVPNGNHRMSMDSLTDTPVVQPATNRNSRMSMDNLTDTPVVQPASNQKSRMSMDNLTDTPVVQPPVNRKSRMSMDSLTDTPVHQFPERKRLRPNNNEVAKDARKGLEKLSKQDRLKRRIEEKYRCKFLDTEAANDDSDSGDEDDNEDDMSDEDGFINDTSQLGYSQDDLDRLNESVEECRNDESDKLHRQFDHQQSVVNQFKTPVFNRRMQLSASEQSQTSLPPSQRGLGNMNFVRSIIDHCRKGGDCDQIETEYHRLAGDKSQDMSMSQSHNDTNMDSESPTMQQVDARQPRQLQHAPATATSNNNTRHNDANRVGLGLQQARSRANNNNVSFEANTSKENTTTAFKKKATGLTAEQKAMIEAKRQAALRLRQQKQMTNSNQQQQQQNNGTQVRFNPYAK